MVPDSHSNLATWRNHFSQLLNVYVVNDVRQTEIHTVEPVVAEPSAFEVELAIEKLKSHKSPSKKKGVPRQAEVTLGVPGRLEPRSSRRSALQGW